MLEVDVSAMWYRSTRITQNVHMFVVSLLWKPLKKENPAHNFFQIIRVGWFWQSISGRLSGWPPVAIFSHFRCQWCLTVSVYDPAQQRSQSIYCLMESRSPIHSSYPTCAPSISKGSIAFFVKLKSLTKPGLTSATKLSSQYRVRSTHFPKLRSQFGPQEVIKIELLNLSAFSVLASRPYPSFRYIFVTDYLHTWCLSYNFHWDSCSPSVSKFSRGNWQFRVQADYWSFSTSAISNNTHTSQWISGQSKYQTLLQWLAGWNSQWFWALPKQGQFGPIGCDLKKPYLPNKSFVLRWKSGTWST
jgi:hypothetical protein